MAEILHQLIGSLSHYLQGLKNIPGGWEWDSFHGFATPKNPSTSLTFHHPHKQQTHEVTTFLVCLVDHEMACVACLGSNSKTTSARSAENPGRRGTRKGTDMFVAEKKIK